METHWDDARSVANVRHPHLVTAFIPLVVIAIFLFLTQRCREADCTAQRRLALALEDDIVARGDSVQEVDSKTRHGGRFLLALLALLTWGYGPSRWMEDVWMDEDEDSSPVACDGAERDT